MEYVNALCVVSETSGEILAHSEEILKLSKNYSHVYLYTLDSGEDLSDLREKEVTSHYCVSIKNHATSRTLDTIFLWAESCPVDLLVLTRNGQLKKEVEDRYGYKRKNIDLIGLTSRN